MTYFRDFTAHSWEFQVNFGGRIVPSKRAVGPIALDMRRGSLPADSTIYKEVDEEANTVEDYAKSRECQEEAQREIQEVQLTLGLPEEEVLGTLAAEGGAPAPRARNVQDCQQLQFLFQNILEERAQRSLFLWFHGMMNRGLRRRDL